MKNNVTAFPKRKEQADKPALYERYCKNCGGMTFELVEDESKIRAMCYHCGAEMADIAVSLQKPE